MHEYTYMQSMNATEECMVCCEHQIPYDDLMVMIENRPFVGIFTDALKWIDLDDKSVHALRHSHFI